MAKPTFMTSANRLDVRWRVFHVSQHSLGRPSLHCTQYWTTAVQHNLHMVSYSSESQSFMPQHFWICIHSRNCSVYYILHPSSHLSLCRYYEGSINGVLQPRAVQMTQKYLCERTGCKRYYLSEKPSQICSVLF